MQNDGRKEIEIEEKKRILDKLLLTINIRIKAHNRSFVAIHDRKQLKLILNDIVHFISFSKSLV